jgi:hypothetical protein
MSDWDDGYAKGRADEREHTAFLHEALLRNQLTDLRAQVETLPIYHSAAKMQYVLRSSVLALINREDLGKVLAPERGQR